MLGGGRRQVVRLAHPFDLLPGLDHARLGEQRRGVLGRAERLEERAREDGRFSDHPVGDLGTLRELEADALEPALTADGLGQVGRPGPGRARIVRRITLERPQVVRPRRGGGLVQLRLHHDERRVVFAREDDDVVALHAPVVGEVEDVVGRAHHQRVEIALGHERAHAVQLGVVSRPGFRRRAHRCQPPLEVAQIDEPVAEVTDDPVPGLDRGLMILVVPEPPFRVVELRRVRNCVRNDHCVVADKQSDVTVVMPGQRDDRNAANDLLPVRHCVEAILEAEHAPADVGAVGSTMRGGERVWVKEVACSRKGGTPVVLHVPSDVVDVDVGQQDDVDLLTSDVPRGELAQQPFLRLRLRQPVCP